MAAALLFLEAPTAASVFAKNGRIAFVAGRLLYTMRPDGTVLSRSSAADAFRFREVASAPDGRRLAVTDYHAEALYVTAAEGTPRRLIARAGGGFYLYPTWSPAADEIAVVALDGGAALPAAATIDVVRVRDGRRRTVVVGGAFPSWSPDGKRIVYHRFEGATGVIREIDADGKHDQAIAAGARMPALSPDGRWIAYISDTNFGDLMLMRADGTDRRTLVRATSKADYALPSWSPDSRHILVKRDEGTHRNGRCCRFSLYVVDRAGGHLRVLRANTDDSRGAWEPATRG